MRYDDGKVLYLLLCVRNPEKFLKCHAGKRALIDADITHTSTEKTKLAYGKKKLATLHTYTVAFETSSTFGIHNSFRLERFAFPYLKEQSRGHTDKFL